MCSWSVLQENKNNKCSQMDFLPSFLPWMLKAELSLPLLHKTAAASCCCCSGHCRPWLNLLLLNNKTIPFPSLTRPDRSSHKWVPWRSSHSVCGVRGCCWNKSASFCIRIFGIHCLHLHLHITATQNSDAEMRRRCPSEQASKQTRPRPPKKPIERNVPTRRKRAANVPEASSLFFERDRWIQTVGEETEFTSLCLCVWLFGEKAQAQAQAQALSLTPISTMEKTDSPVVVVVVHAHTLSSKQDCVELRKLAAPFIHSFLVGLPWSSTAIQLPTKCPTKSQKRRGRRTRKSHTHTHKHTQRTRGGDNGSSTDNQIKQEEINQIDSSRQLQKTVLAIQQKIKHVIILYRLKSRTQQQQISSQKTRDHINPSKTPKHRHTSLSKR